MNKTVESVERKHLSEHHSILVVQYGSQTSLGPRKRLDWNENGRIALCFGSVISVELTLSGLVLSDRSCRVTRSDGSEVAIGR